jgi:hypothetical protein
MNSSRIYIYRHTISIHRYIRRYDDDEEEEDDDEAESPKDFGVSHFQTTQEMILLPPDSRNIIDSIVKQHLLGFVVR